MSIYNKYPLLKKISLSLITDILEYKKLLKSPFSTNKTWSEMGLDELDLVELIMEIELKLDIHIPDELCQIIIDNKPQIFLEQHREDQLNKILDE